MIVFIVLDSMYTGSSVANLGYSTISQLLTSIEKFTYEIGNEDVSPTGPQLSMTPANHER